MSAVQIAGCSCAGKSAVAAALARRGLVALDADDDPLVVDAILARTLPVPPPGLAGQAPG
ncbi:hypothetical protein EAS64_14720 [Trebonia kvetii]|uniref:Dephospho-CoA kinase n=1 Tax=Trebonia kvetii TaxID=2480626 RepID=A0A6P2C3J7_9ACTN|nr:hypothetical protein [Trebonia kvetii]TVZ05740.1 hypothetical protein EAS64_14720 [Trebonia kvetii]